MSKLPPRARALSSLFPFSSLFLLIVILLCAIKPLKTTSPTIQNHPLHTHKHLQVEHSCSHSACEDTLYPQLCASTLSTIPNLSTKSLHQIISSTVNHTVKVARRSASNYTLVIRNKLTNTLDPSQKRALDDCVQLLDYTINHLDTALSLLNNNNDANYYSFQNDMQTLFSAAMTNQYTCLDGFADSDESIIRSIVETSSTEISHLISNSLAMLKKLNPRRSSSKRRSCDNGFPGWMSKKDGRLLVEGPTKFDLVVAKDNSGNFTTIGEAVRAAPNSKDPDRRFVIYIKSGVYLENVEVKKKMLMFVGEGIGKTVVKGNRSKLGGSTTYKSATVAIDGDGFMARYLTIENTAGPSKHQAVALRVSADRSAFYNCSFVGYQDTLYMHSSRQFYKHCDVYGTIDFIFGNAAAVLQNCNLYARRPNPNQNNTITAQGRECPFENTGISIIGSKIAAAEDLIPVISLFKTYLGRPWKNYSRTVIINSQLDALIDPAGWLEWNGNSAPTTLYYGEYMNIGAGSNTTNRVKWPGYRVINNSTEASRFTVENFIQGKEWLPSYDVPYFLGLS